MRQGYYPTDGCIKEDSFMEKLQPKKYVLCVPISIFEVQCISERIIVASLIKYHF